MGLAPAYPIALSKSQHSNYGFYCYRDDGGFCFHNFHSAYAAVHFLRILISDHEYKWLNDKEIAVDNGIRIKGERDSLERAFDHDLTEEEEEFEFNDPHKSLYVAFAHRKAVGFYTGGEEPKPAKKREPMPVELKVKRKKEKIKSGDYITISQICEELGHRPSVCRAALRALKVPKPGHGWAWPPSEAAEVKKRLAKKLA